MLKIGMTSCNQETLGLNKIKVGSDMDGIRKSKG